MSCFNLIGQKFGRLTVIARGANYISGNTVRARWICKCDCGNPNDLLITTLSLKSGHTQSCGCLKNEKISNLNKKYNTYDLSGDYGIGYDSNNKEFYFDLEDYDKIKDYCWLVRDDGYVTNKSKMLYMHRFIMNCENQDIQIDHKNHKCFDNRKNNLRKVTASQNQMNRKSVNKNIKCKSGVSYHTRDCKWQAYITLDNKNHYLGYYDTRQEAENARLKAENKYYKKYSYENSKEVK